LLLYIVRRILNLIPTMLLATFLAWMIIDWAPGDFASRYAQDQRNPEKQAQMREVLGLNQPAPIRYFYWLRNVVTRGDFGQSLLSKGSVTPLIRPKMWNSLILVLPATILSFLIALPLGVYSALNKYTAGDRILTVLTLIGISLPNFFFGLIVVALLMQFFQSFGWFVLPVGGMTGEDYSRLSSLGKFGDVTWHLVAPLAIVTFSSLAGISRFMRGQMLEEINQDYVRTAKAKGLAPRVVNYKHAFRNAIIVIVATIGGVLPGLIIGAGTIEYVIDWPGLTPLFLSSAGNQDVYVLMAILTIFTLLYAIGNLLSDIALAAIDPRIRYA
jgi:peptide/nickel transport system permease protein